MTPPKRDLLALVADNNTEHALRGLLGRPEAMNTRPVDAEIIVHPERDPGCLRKSRELLKPFVRRFRHALVMFDREGCGGSGASREDLEAEVAERLRADWAGRADCVVFDPELEIWVWSDSPHVAAALGWEDRTSDLRAFLHGRGLLEPERIKPNRPKEAVEAALRRAWMPRSSVIYEDLAAKVSLRRCTDPAFAKLTDLLRVWFPRPR